MTTNDGPQVIAIEEHYWNRTVAEHYNIEEQPKTTLDRLFDLGEGRLKEMDAAGIDFQVLSHGAPATQRMDPETAINMARLANDELQETILMHPERYAGFAALPTPEPKEAANELERTVTKYGFKGAMVHGLTNGVFFDDKRFWPIFERAEILDVPLYIHPALPHQAVIDVYFQDYAVKFPWLLRAGWGYTIETATQGIRLILSGVFEKFPKLKIILGHLGESLPFSLVRIDEALSRSKNDLASFKDTFCEHFYITTSGNFSTSALLCSVMEIGVDRIIFSVDWPFVENHSGISWMETIPFCKEDKEKILNGNVKKLLKI